MCFAEMLCMDKSKGECLAFGNLFEKNFQQLAFFANSIVKDWDLAEEIVSDVFFNIWIKRNELHIHSNLHSYLFRAVRNVAINRLKMSKMTFVEISNNNAYLIQSGNDAESHFQYKELKRELDSLINRLPTQRRRIFRLHRLDGLKYNEIAELLSISVNTVRNQMVLAVKYIESYKEQFILQE